MGCGFNKLNNYWNVDCESRCKPDEVLDFEQTPWHYDDNHFEKIQADNILEHLGSTPKIFTNIMKEMYRVSKHGAVWSVIVPHHRCDHFWNDYTHVRVLTPHTFKMFDQKSNFESISKKYSDSTFGLYHDIDLEITEVKYNIVEYWRNQLNEGLIGHKQLDINSGTLSNVIESISITLKVHKPGRYIKWFLKTYNGD